MVKIVKKSLFLGLKFIKKHVIMYLYINREHTN